jgi:hypothetical protein
MSAALANNQKAYLAQLARKGFEKQRAEARAEGAVFAGGELFLNALLNDFEEWRHEQVSRACGKAGLRCCTQSDYNAVKAHFLQMVGADGAAMKALVRAQTDGVRTARAVLDRELTKAGLKPAYAEAIVRRKYKCGLVEASEKQVWTVVYDVRRAKRPKAETRNPKTESV